MEGAPLALGDKNVTWLCQSIDQLAEIFGKAARRCGEGLIDRLPQGVFEILGEAYIHENDRRACFAKGIRERAADLRYPVCRVRLPEFELKMAVATAQSRPDASHERPTTHGMHKQIETIVPLCPRFMSS
jgi:hypothetical protein